jgi:quinol monooxygenase YgiN
MAYGLKYERFRYNEQGMEIVLHLLRLISVNFQRIKNDKSFGQLPQPLLRKFVIQTSITYKTKKMEKVALLAWLQAKPGKEQELADFLKSALPLAQAETGTVSWYAWQIDDSVFGIFDTFEAEEGREAHLSGQIAAALMANADTLLAKPPVIEKLNILAAK